MQNSAEKHMNWKKALFLMCLIWPPVPQAQGPHAAASRILQGRNLAQEVDESNRKEISPSPGPEKELAKPQSGNHTVDANPPGGPVVPKDTCDLNFSQCNNVQNITACLLASAGDSNGMFLLVRNDGENSVQLIVTILPVNSSLDIGDILAHKEKKIPVSLDASRSAAIVINTADWTCIIRRKVGIPLSFPSYMANVKPIYGMYLAFGTVLLIGVFWACCKLGKDVRHLEGVPYQELEMGQQESGPSMNVETLDNHSWDQSWDDDDDWDLEMPVKAPGESQEGNGQTNGISSKSAADGNGWGSEWSA